MTRRKSVGLAAMLAGVIVVVAGVLADWVRGGLLVDADVANSTERQWIVVAAVGLGAAAVALALVGERRSQRLRWLPIVLWLHLALVVFVATYDTSKKIGSTKPATADQLGWGLWLACAGTVVAAVGSVLGARQSAGTSATTESSELS